MFMSFDAIMTVINQLLRHKHPINGNYIVANSILKKLSGCTIVFEDFFLLQMLPDFDESWIILKLLFRTIY